MWDRLRRLDRCCTISFVRAKPNARRWVRAVKTWQIQIQHDRVDVIGAVHVENPTLAEALQLAVEEAERRGWAR